MDTSHSNSGAFRRIISLIKKEFRQYFRNVALIGITFFAIVVDPYAAGEITFDLKQYSYAVWDMDRSALSAQFLDKIREPFFNLVHQVGGYEDADHALESGSVGMVIIIPGDFQRSISAGETAQIQVLFDGSDSNSATIAISYLAGIAEDFSAEVLTEKWGIYDNDIAALPIVEPRTRALYNENLYDRWFMVLAEFFSAITLISILLPAAATVHEKQTGTMEQLIVTPLRVYEIMIAKIVPMSLIILGSIYLGIFVVLKAAVGIPMRGSLAYFTLVTVVYLFTTSGLGMLIATLAKNLAETVLMTLIILIPIVFLSGTFTPPEAMPEWMQFLINFSPMKYFLSIGFGIFLRGVGFNETWQSLAIMASLGIILFTAGALRFRRTFA